jgi:hypothetical protein
MRYLIRPLHVVEDTLYRVASHLYSDRQDPVVHGTVIDEAHGSSLLVSFIGGS